MRLKAVNCVLLACLAAALAAPEVTRSKRHLQQWKDAIFSKFFGNTSIKEQNVRFFRIPGHDNILVKAVPKIETVNTAVVAPEKIDNASPAIEILESYLGTKSASETLSALQGVKHLLQSGILSVRHEPSEVVPCEKTPFLVPPFVSERLEYINPRPTGLISGPPKISLIPVLPPAAEAPQVIEEIVPIKAIPTRVAELIPYPKFSYKQRRKDGSVITYTVKDEISSDVVVTETLEPMPRPPSFVVDRLHKIFLQLPVGTQPVPVRPLPSSEQLYPVPFEVYSPSVIPPIHTVINVPKGEVMVHNYPARKVNIDDKLGSFSSSAEIKVTNEKNINEEPALLLSPPPPFIVERINQAAANSAKVPKKQKSTAFQIVNSKVYGDEQEYLRNPGHVFYNPQPFAAPLTSGYVYRHPSSFKSNPFTVVNIVKKPVYDSKGAVSVKVKNNHVPTSKPNDYYFQSKISSESRREQHPIVFISESVQKMPVPPVHIIKRFQNVVSKANATPVPKISRGYAFKINHGQNISYLNKEELSTEQSTKNKADSGIANSLTTTDKENQGEIYIAGPDLKVSSEGRREQRPFVLKAESVQKMPVPPVHIIERIQNVAVKAHATSLPKISRGYAFNINHGPYVNSNRNDLPTDQSTTNESVSGNKMPSMTKENQGAVYFAGPVPSSYVYKQISQSNPQPFTVVQVKDNESYKTAVPVAMNTHEYVHPDDIRCDSEGNHQVKAQLPEDYFYVPPTASEMPLPTTHKVEKLGSGESQFSYVQVTNNGVFTQKDGAGALNGSNQSKVLSTSVEVSNVLGEKTSSKNLETLSENPIVVAESTYSFTQTHSDGSAMNVKGDSGKGVTVDLSEIEKNRPRGDIP